MNPGDRVFYEGHHATFIANYGLRAVIELRISGQPTLRYVEPEKLRRSLSGVPLRDVVLPPGQLRVLRFIREFAAAQGYPPSRAEISKGMGFASPNAAQEHLTALARKGFIELKPGVSRGIRLHFNGAAKP